MRKPLTDSRAFKGLKALDYLEDKDRYISASNQPTLNFGFIGCGIMGVEHMRNTLMEGRANVSGIYDPAPQSINNALKVLAKSGAEKPPTVYNSLEEACNDPATDALIIATPNFTHLDVMRVATTSGKAIFLEKPIATSVSDAFEVCRLAHNHNNIVRIGLQYRYKAIYAEAIAEIIDRQSIGKVRNVNMLEHRFPFLDKVGQWNKFDEYTGGTLVEKCCHYFDLLNLFAGDKPHSVFASGSQAVNFKDFNYENKPADGLDQAQVVINYDNGVIGGFGLCMFVPGSKEELIVCGDHGRLHATEEAQFGESHKNHLDLWLGEHGVSKSTTPTYPPYISQAGHHGSTFFEHTAFVDDLVSGVYRGPSLADAFWSIVVGATAQESIKQNQLIEVCTMLPENFDEDIFQP